MSVILQDRLEAVKAIPLSIGSHPAPAKGETPCAFCAMEKWAWITGRNWTDRPDNCSPAISAFIRSFQDNADQGARDAVDAWMITNADRLAATVNDDHDQARGFLAADWATRVALPLWLDVAGATDAASSLRRRAAIGSRAEAKEMREAITDIRSELKLPSWLSLREDLRQRVREAVRKALAEKKGAAWAVEAAGAAEAAWAAWAVEAAWAAGAAGAAEAAWAAEAAGAAWAAEAVGAAWAVEAAWAAEAAEAAWAVEAAGAAWAAEAVEAAEAAWAFRKTVREAVRAKILELWGEKFAPTTTEIKANAMVLLDQMLAVGEK